MIYYDYSMSFKIYIVYPCDNSDSFAFLCFEDYIKSIFHNSIYKWNICHIWQNSILDNTNADDIFIFLSWISQNHKASLQNHRNKYILNMEQMSQSNHVSITINNIKDGYKYIDYSKTNIKILMDKLGATDYIYLPYQIVEPELYYNKGNNNKIYDIGAIALYNSRKRREILDSLNNLKGVQIKHICDWGEQRDKVLFQCKILINVHYSDIHTVYEEIRCNRCTANRVIVVSEESMYQSDEAIIPFKNHIIFVPYDQLISKALDVLANYEKYYQELFNDNDKDIENHIIENNKYNFDSTVMQSIQK